MKLYETVTEYLENFNVGDIVIFGGHGIMDGIRSNNSKHDVYKVHENTTTEKIVIRGYRGRSNLTMDRHSHNQELAVLTPKEYSALPILY